MSHALTYLLGPDATYRDAPLAVVDVAVVGFLVFRVLRVIRGTRAVAVLLGLGVLGVVYLAAEWTGLYTLSWLLGRFLSASFIFGVIVLFQADLRRALAELGRGSRLLARLTGEPRAAQVGMVDAVVKAAAELARARVGALVVLEQTADLGELAGAGLRVDAALTPELLLAIFDKGSPLHDGAVVVRGGRIAAAGCILPLSVEPAAQELGTRHRAAVGLADEVDAAVVVVSEERGEISLALDGVLHRHLDEAALRALLHGAPSLPAGRGEAASSTGSFRSARARTHGGGRRGVRSSDALLRLVALAIAVGLVVLVRGERNVTVAFAVPVAPRLPPGLAAAPPLPAEVSVPVTGPWSRLRAIDGADLGPAVVDLSHAGPGRASWAVRPEALHVPHGVRVESIYPGEGTIELTRPGGASAGPP